MNKFYIWGQPVETKGKYWHTSIRKTFIQKGQRIKVGLNEKLVKLCAEENGIFVVTLEDKGVTFKMSGQKWLRTGKIHNEPSIKTPGTTFIIYEVEVPLDAFKEMVKAKKMVELDKNQLELI